MDEEVKNKLDTFFKEFKQEDFKKGQLLIRAMEEPKGIFFLREGLVKMYAISKKGDESVLTIFKPYSFFPMSWAINNSKNIYFFETMTPVTANIVSKDKIIKYLEKNPDILLNLLSRVYKGLDGVLLRMNYLMSGDAYSRLVAELVIEAKRFGEKNNTHLKMRISENDLAIESGMTRETVSREIKKLKNKGLISIKDRELTIPSLTKLEQEISD